MNILYNLVLVRYLLEIHLEKELLFLIRSLSGRYFELIFQRKKLLDIMTSFFWKQSLLSRNLELNFMAMFDPLLNKEIHKTHTIFTQKIKISYNIKTRHSTQSQAQIEIFIIHSLSSHFFFVFLFLYMGVTGFYRRLWNHLCFSHDVCIGRYHQNRQTLSAKTLAFGGLTRFKTVFSPALVA